MIIPLQQLNSDVLDNIIESFVLREGTDYGFEEISLDDKKQQVKDKLLCGEWVIVYSELHETVNIMERHLFEQGEQPSSD
ncbi:MULTISPECIES: YheU family protein [unclassified Thalassotalea]|uniref:YheU family protein n=1 Tax=unclassified Thalassotalea TaxID=2614972 RepID=UPI0010806CF4|nr:MULTISPECIES: YheU family protein [unclassified Thalassotalea]NMP16002.1 YheU family protein [Thalassotalea sp. Y01]QBY04011.1 YheU family protein [Thalassotalea sp. HSM 43]